VNSVDRFIVTEEVPRRATYHAIAGVVVGPAPAMHVAAHFGEAEHDPGKHLGKTFLLLRPRRSSTGPRSDHRRNPRTAAASPPLAVRRYPSGTEQKINDDTSEPDSRAR
jgi:hypothetical protein